MTGIALLPLVLLGGLGVFALSCRLSPVDCWDDRTARRVAAWRRASPWLAVFCAAIAAGLWLYL